MVSLLDTVAAASDFCKFVGKWTGEIGREDSNQLVAVGHFSCQLIVEEGTREIEVAKEELVEAVTVRGIGEVSAEDEGTVGCVGGSCVGVTVGFTRLAAAIDGKTGSDDAVGFLLDEHLAT